MGVEKIWRLILVHRTKVQSKGGANINGSTLAKVKDAHRETRQERPEHEWCTHLMMMRKKWKNLDWDSGPEQSQCPHNI